MPQPICTADELLTALDSRKSLYAFLQSKLDWKLDPEDTFTYNDENAVGRAASRAELGQIVPFSAGDPFVIFLVEFRDRFLRGDLREILRGVRKEIKNNGNYKNADLDELVFVCRVPDTVDADGTKHPAELRFVHFEERENRQPRLRVFGFDRETVGETYTLRDVNLRLLRLETNLLGEVNWDACRKNWMDAWNVEKVTKQFFKDYREVFTDVEKNHVQDAPGDRRLFVQRFFNRLMFIHFLSKKGWLRAPGKTKDDNGREYLHDLWNVYQARDKRTDAPGDTFYRQHLTRVFFLALNEPHVSRNNELLTRYVGDAPYLNGGLFEQTEDDKADFTIQDAAFEKIWERLFSCYNFTVAESTPDDQDVAVDPEMLGKVFEELVTGRHESGSYYTPRPVVQFMCREALKGYLAPCGAGIEKFVDFHKADDITNHEAVLSALKSVKVVDPACGSGAYLLGMLQELMALRLVLFNAKRLDDESSYKRKLEIIQNNIYGVDLDMFAVNTARLRLWLSLVVEQKTNPLDTPNVSVALPNLDFKIEEGNSVCCPDPSGGLQLSLFRETDLRTLADKRLRYGDVSYKGTKSTLKDEIESLSREIKVEAKLEETAFDWRVDFGEVFQRKEAISDLGGAMNFGGTLAAVPEPGGFDIVLANPPYVRGELIKDQKPFLRKAFGDRFGGTMDLYCFFYFRAIELLKEGGQLVFITPNKWFRAGYGEKLRAEIARTCRVRSITDFGDLPVFESATAYPMIFIAQKGHDAAIVTRIAEPKTLAAPYPDVRAVTQSVGFALPASAITGSVWNLSVSATSGNVRVMRSAGVPLGKYVDGKIYYGLKTGYNEAFVIDGKKRDELIAADSNNAKIIVPFAGGRDIKRWCLEGGKKWLILTKIGTKIDQHAAVLAHLDQWKTELQARQDKGEFHHELRPCTYYNSFDVPKIIFPDIAAEARFAYDETGTYFGNTAYIMPVDDKFLLGVLNSRAVEEFYLTVSAQVRGGYLRFIRQYVEQIPIPKATSAEQAEIAALVQQCLDKCGQGVAEIEAEINERVAALYGL